MSGMETEYAFEMATSGIRFGHGATREAGHDLRDLGVRRVMVLTDPVIRHLPPLQTVLESLEGRVEYAVFDRVRVEPTDESFLEAARLRVMAASMDFWR
jgi:hydroxyacid-oxoacid transhydrogenase